MGLCYYTPSPGSRLSSHGDPPDGVLLDRVARTEPDQATADHGTPEPIPIASPAGPRKPHTPVHHAIIEPTDNR